MRASHPGLRAAAEPARRTGREPQVRVFPAGRVQAAGGAVRQGGAERGPVWTCPTREEDTVHEPSLCLRLQTLNMWEKPFLLLLLHSVEAVMASQCWQGATFSQAVVSPAVATPGRWTWTIPREAGGTRRAEVGTGTRRLLVRLRREETAPTNGKRAAGERGGRASAARPGSEPRPRGTPAEETRTEPGGRRLSKTQGGTVSPSTADSTHQELSRTTAPPPAAAHWPSSTTAQTDRSSRSPPTKPGHTSDIVMTSAAAAPPTTHHPPAKTVTSDPPTATAPLDNSPAPPSAVISVSDAVGWNVGPVAVVGPDRKLFLPLGSLLLDGSGSTDDHGIASYRWDAISGPPGLQLEDGGRAVATATGLRAGRYTFRLTVADRQGATDSASLTVAVEDAARLPPVAHASGSHTLTLPNNSLVLRGSVSDGDQTRVRYLWVRDSQSPAAGDVLYGSESHASLYLANLVEGTYLFQLRVTDAQGRSSAATATVEVRPEPGGGEEVELEMLVSVSQVSLSQRDTVVRQLAALLHVLDSDIQVRALQGHSHLSSVLRLWVRGPSGPLPGSRLVGLLRKQLLREKSDFLLFRVLRVDTVVCLLRCSGRGQCDPVTKDCTCDPFWTQNVIRRYLGDGESNCEWRVLYVVLTSVLLVAVILSLSWTFVCCRKRGRRTRARTKTKYTILDNMDEQERVELRPKFSIKHRSTEHNSSLMMSESELDSDQDTIFSRDRPVHSRNRLLAQAGRSGNAFG